MAALGKILRKDRAESAFGTGNGYNSVRYEPLNQDPVDNEQEDDDVVFVREGKVNGSVTNGNTPAEIQELRSSMHENIEVGDLGLQTAKVSRRKPQSDVEVKVMKQGTLTRTRIGCFIASCVLLVICIISFVFVLPRLTAEKLLLAHGHHNQTANWHVRLDDYASEAPIRLFDVDEDRILDIILGGVDGTCYTQAMKEALKRHNQTESEKHQKAKVISGKTQPKKTKTINQKRPTESCVRLLDVDEDGIDDIVIGIAVSWILDDAKIHREKMKEICRNNNVPFPCVGKIVALRGYDGKKLWEMSTYMEVFEINCGNIDIDKDGKMDCIGTGRMSTAVAFDPRKGSVLWEGDVSVLKDTWNTYNVLILPDYTGDGVPEVLLPHGGEPSFPPTLHCHRPTPTHGNGAITRSQHGGRASWQFKTSQSCKKEKDRYPGRLIVLDGATGKALGRYLEMPDSRELYSSPVLHTKHDGAQYILFGHGGETISGSLLAISAPDLWRYVREMETMAPVPNTRGNYDDWEQKLKRDPNTGILEIYRATDKGVMVPPVLVEMTGDATKDIFMSAYEGIFILYDGETLEQIWKAAFPDFETYSTPAPGYFTADDTLDFMLHISKGNWPKYKYSLTIILDGSSGKVIWSLNSTMYEMTSDLVARTYSRNPPRDAFVFRVRGRGEKDGEAISHGVIKQDGDPMDTGDPTRRRRDAFGRKTYRGPPTDRPYFPPEPPAYPPVPRPPNFLPKNPYPYNFNRRLPSERQRQQQGPQYRPPPPPPQYQQPEYYDAGTADADGNDEAYYTENHYAPEYDNNGGLIVGEDKDAQENEAEEEELHDGEEVETIIFPPYESACSKEKLHTSEMFIMDRSVVTAPIRIISMQDYTFNYNLTESDRTKAENVLMENYRGKRSATKPNVKFGIPEMKDALCTVMRVQEVNTAAIGDVDGDGSLDVIAIFHSEGHMTDERHIFLHNHYESQIHKINLDDILSNGDAVTINPVVSSALQKQQAAETQTLRQMRFALKQPWSQYLGPQTDSIYH